MVVGFCVVVVVVVVGFCVVVVVVVVGFCVVVVVVGFCVVVVVVVVGFCVVVVVVVVVFCVVVVVVVVAEITIPFAISPLVSFIEPLSILYIAPFGSTISQPFRCTPLLKYMIEPHLTFELFILI